MYKFNLRKINSEIAKLAIKLKKEKEKRELTASIPIKINKENEDYDYCYDDDKEITETSLYDDYRAVDDARRSRESESEKGGSY